MERCVPACLSVYLLTVWQGGLTIPHVADEPAVRVGAIKFSQDQRNQCCIRAMQPIPPNEFLWELSGLLSKDPVLTSPISSIVPHLSQNMGKEPHLMTGPARFVNHSCRPNAIVGTSFKISSTSSEYNLFQLFPLPGKLVYVIKTLVDIPVGHEVTVDYGRGYWEQGTCLCSTCSLVPPSYISPAILTSTHTDPPPS